MSCRMVPRSVLQDGHGYARRKCVGGGLIMLQIFLSSQAPETMASSSAREWSMIDGLKLTMTGEELRKRLNERVKDHERSDD